ncbi:MAG: c(7)-type cytochrome triheme domain-containing protein [Thermoleophilia bacterium]
MKRIIMIMPVLIATMAVGFIFYRGPEASGGEDPFANQSVTTGAASDAYEVPGEIIFTRPVESVAFSHEIHAVELEFKCDSCHGGLFEMKAGSAEGNEDFTMAGLAEGKYCGACHSAETETAFASDTQCARCHIGVKGLEEEEAAH